MTQDQERAAFEAWAIDRWHSVNRTAFAWEAWQARAALAAPQPAQARQALTDRQIAECMVSVSDPLAWGNRGDGMAALLKEFARAIEAAHGIPAAQAAKDQRHG